MNIKKKIIEQFHEETGLYLLFNDFYDIDETEDSEIKKVSINGFDKDGEYICKSFSAPRKKEITLSYLMEKLNRDDSRVYRNLCGIFKKILPQSGGNFYATSYGIGFDTFMLSIEGIEKETKVLTDFLNQNNIKFRNEFSDARWIYRFVISKEKSNLEKITNLSI